MSNGKSSTVKPNEVKVVEILANDAEEIKDTKISANKAEEIKNSESLANKAEEATLHGSLNTSITN